VRRGSRPAPRGMPPASRRGAAGPENGEHALVVAPKHPT
jgi:hypothetical protein